MFTPSVQATAFVATALAVCALLVAMLGGWVALPVPPRLTHGLGLALSAVFLLRAIGDFKHIGFFKQVRHTRFSRFDTFLFSPLCLLIAVGVFLVALT